MNPPETPRRLGRGLDALLARRDVGRDSVPAAGPAETSGRADTEQTPQNALRTIPISQIRANPYQPRHEFNPEDLADLESSLRVSGLLQPITVRPAPNGTGYELIAGERRFRAATRLGWNEIPAIVRETDDRTLLTLAMVENLQRADLDPIEEADGYHRLMEEFALSQQEVADVVGKDRSTVANALRLRQLPAAVRRFLQEKQLSAGHARALLPLVTERAITDLARETVANGYSVREVERRVQAGRAKPATTGRKSAASTAAAAAVPAGASSAEVRRLEELVRKKLQTTVNIHLTARDRGEVRIAFFSNDDLERVLELLGVKIDQ